jgi:cell division protein FtsQ
VFSRLRGNRRRAAGGATNSRRRFELGAVRQRAPRRRLHIPFRRIAVTLVVFAAIGGTVYGAGWLLLGDTLRVRDVTVVGAQITDPFAIVRASGVGGESLLTLDAGEAAARIAALEGVRDATVHRDWPNGVIIDVTEDQAWGYWQVGEVRRLISADGKVLGLARAPAEGAPTIIEVGPPATAENPLLVEPDRDTVQLVARLSSDSTFKHLRVTPTGFIFRRDRGLTVLVEQGPHAVFGDSHNYEFKVAAWGALLGRIEEQQIDANEIDLRFGKSLVLR